MAKACSGLPEPKPRHLWGLGIAWAPFFFSKGFMSTHFKGTVYADAFSPEISEPDVLTVGTSSDLAAATVDSIAVGSGGTIITKIVKGAMTVNPESLALAAVADLAVTVAGAVVGDAVIVNPPATALGAGFVVTQVWVSATDTITLRFFNAAGTDPLDIGSGSWTYTLIRS